MRRLVQKTAGHRGMSSEGEASPCFSLTNRKWQPLVNQPKKAAHNFARSGVAHEFLTDVLHSAHFVFLVTRLSDVPLARKCWKHSLFACALIAFSKEVEVLYRGHAEKYCTVIRGTLLNTFLILTLTCSLQYCRKSHSKSLRDSSPTSCGEPRISFSRTSPLEEGLVTNC